MEKPVREHALAKAAEYVATERLQNAKAIMQIAKIATRTDQESREDALTDPRVERMIVDARELCDADLASLPGTPVTR